MYRNPPYYLSAYGIACKRGFHGTEDEWLESLSAYGIAKANGFAGSEAEWLEYLTAYGLAKSMGYEGSMEQWLESLHGATFIPQVKDGILSWNNDKGLPDPESINLYDIALGGIGRIIPFTIPVKAWVEDPNGGEYRFYYDLCHIRISSSMVPQITLEEESIRSAAECGMCPTVKSNSGYIRLKAMERPEKEINATCYLSAMHIPDSGVQDYELPVASEKVLGGIKGSDTIRIDEDGTAHAVSASNGEIAADGEVEKLLNEIFGTSN